MLPFLKDNKEGSASAPVSQQRKPDEAEEYDVLESAAEDLCHALERKDYKAIAAAIRAAFELLDSQPHSEGPHV